MQLVLVAAADFDILRSIIEIFPQDEFKPLATRSADHLVEKLKMRQVPLAIVHESFMGERTVEYCDFLCKSLPGLKTIYLRDPSRPNSVNPKDVPFDPPGRSLTFPCAEPILARAISSLIAPEFTPPNEEEQMNMLRQLQQRIADAGRQNHYQRLFCPTNAPHYALVESFDHLTNEFHPDRFRWVMPLEPYGMEIYGLVNDYYKMVVESWNTLKNRNTRREYDESIGIR